MTHARRTQVVFWGAGVLEHGVLRTGKHHGLKSAQSYRETLFLVWVHADKIVVLQAWSIIIPLLFEQIVLAERQIGNFTAILWRYPFL